MRVEQQHWTPAGGWTQIAGTAVCDDLVVATALELERSRSRGASVRLCALERCERYLGDHAAHNQTMTLTTLLEV